MVERVARAMMESDGCGHLLPAHYTAFAIAAIEAMREPTHEMADRGESALICGPLVEDNIDAPSETWAKAKTCYRAMIDAALTSSGPAEP